MILRKDVETSVNGARESQDNVAAIATHGLRLSKSPRVAHSVLTYTTRLATTPTIA